MVWNEGGVLTFLLWQRMKFQEYFSENRANIDVEKKVGTEQPAGLGLEF